MKGRPWRAGRAWRAYRRITNRRGTDHREDRHPFLKKRGRGLTPGQKLGHNRLPAKRWFQGVGGGGGGWWRRGQRRGRRHEYVLRPSGCRESVPLRRERGETRNGNGKRQGRRRHPRGRPRSTPRVALGSRPGRGDGVSAEMLLRESTHHSRCVLFCEPHVPCEPWWTLERKKPPS